MKNVVFPMLVSMGLMCGAVIADDTPLGEQMELIDDAYKGLKRVEDAAAGVKDARAAQAAILKAVTLVPEMVGKMPDGPAKEKAIRKAKLNVIKIPRGCSSYDCSCDEEHSIHVGVKGKCSSVVIELIPAPQGTGLVIGDEMKKILKAVGIKDVYSKTSGKVKTTFNAAKALMKALDKLGDIEA